MSPHRFARVRGFTLLETLAVLAVAAFLLVGLMSLVNTSYSNTRAQQAALYQSQLSNAAQQLIQSNYQALLTAPMTTTTPLVISLTTSSPAGYKLASYLPASTRPQNAYQQTPCLLVYRGTGTGWTGGSGPQDIEAFVVTEGGQTIDDRTLGNIEANAGAGAGVIQAVGNGVAQGAFGSWSAPLATVNAANKSCSGTLTTTGHLVSQVYYGGNNDAAGELLYREPVSVTGVSDGNTMHAPIVLADHTHTDRTSDAACGGGVGAGKITADAGGDVLNCDGVMWSVQGSMHWRAPVANYTDLSSLSPQAGDVVLVSSLASAFAWSGSAWKPLGLDQNGNLTVPGQINLRNNQVIGAACSPASASETAISTNAQGYVLSCQNGTWQTEASLKLVWSDPPLHCQNQMTTAGESDPPTCSPAPPSGSHADFLFYPFSYDATRDIYYYTHSISVTLTQAGVVSATSWSRINDELCGSAKGTRVARVSQTLDIYDSSGTGLSHSESKSRKVANSSATINNALLTSLAAGTYTVTIVTGWKTFAGISTPWWSSACPSGSTIYYAPLKTGWSVQLLY